MAALDLRPTRASLFPTRWALATLLAACALPALAQPTAPLPKSLATATQALESALDGGLGKDGLPHAHREEMTRQGWAEALGLHDQLLESGAVSPRGWVNDCASLARQVREWLWRTDTLTGAYVGAVWLEQWGVSCAPTLATVWQPRDEALVARAVGRARAALPRRWPVEQGTYDRRTVAAYLRAFNRHGGLSIPDRACARAAVAHARAGTWSLPRAQFEASACNAPPAHAVVLDPALAEQWTHEGLAGLLATPFLGLDRWVVPPRTLAMSLAQPGVLAKALSQMTMLSPPPAEIMDRQRLLVQALPAPNPRNADMQAQMGQFEPVLTWPEDHWPTQARCQSMHQGLLDFLPQVSHPEVLHAALAGWLVLEDVCPGMGPHPRHASLVDAAAARAAASLPEGDVRTRLAAPVFATYLEQVRQQDPPARARCIQSVLAQRRALGDVPAPALRRARAMCPVAYQASFLVSEPTP